MSTELTLLLRSTLTNSEDTDTVSKSTSITDSVSELASKSYQTSQNIPGISASQLHLNNKYACCEARNLNYSVVVCISKRVQERYSSSLNSTYININLTIFATITTIIPVTNS